MYALCLCTSVSATGNLNSPLMLLWVFRLSIVHASILLPVSGEDMRGVAFRSFVGELCSAGCGLARKFAIFRCNTNMHLHFFSFFWGVLNFHTARELKSNALNVLVIWRATNLYDHLFFFFVAELCLSYSQGVCLSMVELCECRNATGLLVYRKSCIV